MPTYPASAYGRDTRSDRLRYEQLRGDLHMERSSFMSHWQEIAEVLVPRRTRFQTSERNKGDKRNTRIIDSSARFAARTLQSGLHAGITSPARPWMRLSVPDQELASFEPVKAWLHLVTRRMLDMFIRSNIYQALPTLYGDMGCFATGAMGVVEDGKDLLRCYTYPVGSYAIGLDARGVASTFTRDYALTVRQVVQTFGRPEGGDPRAIDWTRFSQAVRQAWDTGKYETAVDVTWMVTPNEHADPNKLGAQFLPFHSCYFERGRNDGSQFLRESGFRTFPVLVPRWDCLDGDSYGTDCPAMTALGDMNGLQIMQRRSAQAIDKALNPPLVGPSDLMTQKVSLLPGGITYSNVRDGMQGLRPIHEIRLEGLEWLERKIEGTQRRISRAFYEDLFLMLATSDLQGSSQPVTAREIDERHEEKLLALGPVLERTNDELLDPLIDRVFGMMLEAGAIPEPPEDLAGVDLKVEYISLMSQAQKLVGVVGQDRFLQAAVFLAQTFPNVRHKVHVFQAMNDYGDMLGVNPKLIRTDEEATALEQAEQQAIADAQQAEQLKSVAGAAQALGNTSMEQGDTALSRVLDNAA